MSWSTMELGPRQPSYPGHSSSLPALARPGAEVGMHRESHAMQCQRSQEALRHNESVRPQYVVWWHLREVTVGLGDVRPHGRSMRPGAGGGGSRTHDAPRCTPSPGCVPRGRPLGVSPSAREPLAATRPRSELLGRSARLSENPVSRTTGLAITLPGRSCHTSTRPPQRHYPPPLLAGLQAAAGRSGVPHPRPRTPIWSPCVSTSVDHGLRHDVA